MRAIRTCLLASLVLAAPAPAFAWSADGHRAVCLIAYEQLTDAAKTGVGALLDIAGDTAFAETCTWADEVLKSRPDTAGWHGITLPKDAREFDLARDCGTPASCVIAQVERHASIVKSAAPKPERAEALKFLAHLIGDLHQPLNVSFTDHRSGRQISGMFHGLPSNLHDVWERGLLSTLVPAGKPAAPIIFDAAAWSGRLTGADRKTPLAWANETLWVTVAPPTGYLGNQGGDFFGERYIRQNRPVALEQIDRAGVRLADLLNDALR
ncbi:MAG: S1/P1 nuclease [Rhodospirillaceae bacterium]